MLDLDQRDVKYLPGVGPARAALLKGELQISTLQDLLYFFLTNTLTAAASSR